MQGPHGYREVRSAGNAHGDDAGLRLILVALSKERLGAVCVSTHIPEYVTM